MGNNAITFRLSIPKAFILGLTLGFSIGLGFGLGLEALNYLLEVYQI